MALARHDTHTPCHLGRNSYKVSSCRIASSCDGTRSRIVRVCDAYVFRHSQTAATHCRLPSCSSCVDTSLPELQYSLQPPDGKRVACRLFTQPPPPPRHLNIDEIVGMLRNIKSFVWLAMDVIGPTCRSLLILPELSSAQATGSNHTNSDGSLHPNLHLPMAQNPPLCDIKERGAEAESQLM